MRWWIYTHDDPIGEDRADLRAGIIAAATTNSVTRAIHVFAGKGQLDESALMSPSDFMPKWGELKEEGKGTKEKDRQPMTEDEWREAKEMAKALYGGQRMSI